MILFLWGEFSSPNIPQIFLINFFFFFLATPTAYGSSQARDGIPDAAAIYATAMATLDP